MHCPVKHAATQCPEQLAINELTYAELNALIENYLLQLREIKSGQRIAFLALPNVETIALYFAILRTEAVCCPLNYRLPQIALDEQIKRLETHALIECNGKKIVIKHFSSSICDQTISHLLFTSGSSATPKIAALTTDNFVASAQSSAHALNITSKTRYLLSLPLYHVSGLIILWRCFLQNATLVVLKDINPQSISDHHVTVLSCVPTQLVRWKEHLSKLDAILLGGAPIPRTLFSLKLPLFFTYGMTEMCSSITIGKAKLGAPLPDRELIISHEGEILVRGRTLFRGYWHAPGHIELPLKNDWFATGDLGSITPNEGLIFKGRKDRMIISGGENIQPEEIEKALMEIEGIEQAIVIGIPDQEFGQRPVAFLNCCNDLSQSQINMQLSQRFPKYKIPDTFLNLPEKKSGFKYKITDLEKCAQEALLSHR